MKCHVCHTTVVAGEPFLKVQMLVEHAGVVRPMDDGAVHVSCVAVPHAVPQPPPWDQALAAHCPYGRLQGGTFTRGMPGCFCLPKTE